MTLRDDINKAFNLIECRNSVPFNGVLGSPPEWFPEIHAKEFTRLRDQILNTPFYERKITHEQVIAWMDEWRDLHLPKGDISHSVPVELQEIIGKLSQYRYAVSLDEMEGLNLLGGEYAVMGKRKSISTSINASKPRPKKNYDDKTLDTEIATLKRNYPNYKPSELWVHLKTAIESWSDADCKEYGEKDSRSYHYGIGDERGSIAYGTFRKKLKK